MWIQMIQLKYQVYKGQKLSACRLILHAYLMSANFWQEGQVALNRSPEFCLKLTYRFLLKAGHVPTKFGQNPASSLGGDILWSNCWRRTTHNGRRTSNDHNSSLWANGSGELKISPFKKYFRNTIRVLSSLNIDQVWLLSSRIRVLTVCKGGKLYNQN